VLVVEDDADLARVLAETFERRGVAAEVAGTGERAWNAARRRRPDAVVLDIALPDGDGYWLAERFRELEGLRSVPIVAYTALDPDEPGRDRLRRAGVDVLTKSRIEPVELERRVMALLDAAGSG
jgi:DNA-binding response OmpR family regulator